ncbi:Eyes absent-like protein [Drosera capensis]
MIVYIWDLDETLILVKSLMDGSYAEAFNGVKDVEKSFRYGKMWERYILDVSDRYFFYEQIENCNHPSLDALKQYDDGLDLSGYDFNGDGFSPLDDDLNKRKLAYRHRVVAQKYKQGLHAIMDQETIDGWNDLYEITDRYTDGWLSSARTFLQNCSSSVPSVNNTESEHVNVLVTSGSLIPSLVKCLLYKLDGLIACENVYSSRDVGKQKCFSWIAEHFVGENVQFCVIGDGWEECEAAEAMRWPFIQIDPKPDGFHRFPGLTLQMVGNYLSVVYEPSDDE